MISLKKRDLPRGRAEKLVNVAGELRKILPPIASTLWTKEKGAVILADHPLDPTSGAFIQYWGEEKGYYLYFGQVSPGFSLDELEIWGRTVLEGRNNPYPTYDSRLYIGAAEILVGII